MTKQEKMDLHYLRKAHLTAIDLSKDPKTKVGTIIMTPDTKHQSVGYNGFAAGIEETPEKWSSPLKHEYVVHSEENALLNCTFDKKGCWSYTSVQPCHKCLIRMVNAGIKRLVFTKLYDKIKHDIWNEHAKKLDELILVEGNIGDLNVPLEQLKYSFHTIWNKSSGMEYDYGRLVRSTEK